MQSELTVDELLRRFAGFLSTNFVYAGEGLHTSLENALWNDWAQANWELLVEAPLALNGFPLRLDVYGDGADCSQGSSRVSFPRDRATHRVVVRPRGATLDNLLGGATIAVAALPFDRFVALDGTWFCERPPFDKALAMMGNAPVVLGLDSIAFTLEQAAS